jgi:peptide/nickel transport system ATP-binding protein
MATAAPSAAQTVPVLALTDLRVAFPINNGVVQAVDGVSLTVGAGETLGIVGESGSGKSVTALAVMRLLEAPGRVSGGSVRFQGRDVLAMSAAELCAMRGGHLAMVFQDPMTSLNPVLSIARQVAEAMVAHGKGQREATGWASRSRAAQGGPIRISSRAACASAWCLPWA